MTIAQRSDMTSGSAKQPNPTGQGAIRIGIVSDIHHGSRNGYKQGDVAVAAIRKVLQKSSEFDLDLFVDLGDRINDKSPDQDRVLMEEIAAELRSIGPRVEHLVGNHDLHHLSVDENSTILGKPVQSRRVAINGFNIVMWSPALVDEKREYSDQDLAWLSSAVKPENGPSIVFTHFPFDEGSMVGNYYFEADPYGKASAINVRWAREVIRESENVIAVVAGHVHWNSTRVIDNTVFITIQSLTESFTTLPSAAEAWAVLDLGDELVIRTFGNDPMEYRRPIRLPVRNWIVPRKGSNSLKCEGVTI